MCIVKRMTINSEWTLACKKETVLNIEKIKIKSCVKRHYKREKKRHKSVCYLRDMKQEVSKQANRRSSRSL